MAYFEWTDDLVIDHGPIDHDHRKLVDLVNQLHTATALGHGQETISEVLATLIVRTRDHLQREEILMSTIQFPNLDDHRQDHVQFMDELRELQRQYAAGSITIATQLSATLRDWLTLHIRRSDREIKSFLRQIGNTPALPATWMDVPRPIDMESKE